MDSHALIVVLVVAVGISLDMKMISIKLKCLQTIDILAPSKEYQPTNPLESVPAKNPNA